jgi:hypothetical protein
MASNNVRTLPRVDLCVVNGMTNSANHKWRDAQVSKMANELRRNRGRIPTSRAASDQLKSKMGS